MLIDTRRDRVRTLRAIAPTRDALALRRSIERAFDGVELRPPGLPAKAIVCVRRVRAAVPPRVDAAWSAALVRPLEQLVGAAARPFHEMVPADSAAVRFDDEAELVACLARDWSRRAVDVWWWRGILNDVISDTLIQRVLLSMAHCVPAALELLWEKQLAARVVAALPAPYCDRLRSRVVELFGAASSSAPAAVSGQGSQAAVRSDAMIRAEVWVRGVLTSDTEVLRLHRWPRALLGMSLALRRAPTLARSQELVRVLDTEPAIALESAGRDGSSAPTPNEFVPPAERSEVRGAVELVEAEPSLPRVTSARKAATSSGGPQVENGRERHTAADPPATHSAQLPATVESGDSHRLVRQSLGDTPSQGVRRCTEVSSECAGIIYLINLALALDLYGDFTQPAKVGLPVPLADFLLLVGERVVGPRWNDDPVTTVLAALRGCDEPRREPPDEEWLANLVAMLDARAAAALGVECGHALRFLCIRSGRIVLSATRLDVFYSLADHPLAIRLAGLDRNPGWVPSAGRVIELHYD